MSVNTKPLLTLNFNPSTFDTLTLDDGSLISSTVNDGIELTISVNESNAAGSVFDIILATCVCSVLISAVTLDDAVPLVPEYVAPEIYTLLPVNDLPFGKFSPIKFKTPD